MIGNIERDCNSARKYWHFIKVMGRSASHIALECALQCQPNVCIISEEVEKNDMTLNQIVDNLCQVIAFRASQGNHFGTVIVPEGLIEFIPAIGRLIQELNDLLAAHGAEYKDLDADAQREYIIAHLSKENAATFETLPADVARQLSLDRDPHGNVQEEWVAGGVPITMMMNMERRNGKMKPVIRKALVDLDGNPFKTFVGCRDRWAKETCYVYPGPIQYWGPSEVCDQPTKTLALEHVK